MKEKVEAIRWFLRKTLGEMAVPERGVLGSEDTTLLEESDLRPLGKTERGRQQEPASPERLDRMTSDGRWE